MPEQNWIENPAIFRRRKMALEQPPQRRHVHWRATMKKKPTNAAQRKFIRGRRPRFVRNVPNDSLPGNVILEAGLHRAIVKIMISPVVGEVLDVDDADLFEATGRNHHSLTARRMVNRNVLRQRRFILILISGERGMPWRRRASPLGRAFINSFDSCARNAAWARALNCVN